MSINKNTTFVIWSFNFDWKVGGIYALHFLAKKLSDRGYRVFCIADKTMRNSNVKTIGRVYAEEMAKRENVVVIYPEVVSGNPLMAKNPVRWIMYYPGAHGSGDFVYAENECKVTYHDIFVEKTVYKGCPLLHIRDSNIKNFYDMNTQGRDMDVVLIKKGQLGPQSIQERSDKYLSPFASNLGIGKIVLFDEIIASSKSMQDLNAAFNKVRYFISFDIETYHSVLAAMAGCISVIVPTDSVTKEELFDRLPDWKYGIAYGLGDLEHASSTKHLLYEYAEKMEQENDESIDRLEKAIHDKFGL